MTQLEMIQSEFRKHDFDTFVDEPPCVAQGGKGVVIPACPNCRKKIYDGTVH